MALKQVIEAIDILDGPTTGSQVAECIRERGLDVELIPAKGTLGRTFFLNVHVQGLDGKLSRGDAPTLGIVGMLGGIGARPNRTGLVSDADGAICALAVCLKLADMKAKGDLTRGDVLVSTHICPDAPITPHDPVPFMGTPVEMVVMNKYQVYPAMDAVLSIDATKGNRVLNRRGIAVSPTVKEGWILPVADDLLDILQFVTGEVPAVLPLSTYDITPYGNGLPHLNSILQPSTATPSPVVGVAVTAQVAVPGCATGASHPVDLDMAVRFAIEVARAFGERRCAFYDEQHYRLTRRLYGPMMRLQTPGREVDVDRAADGSEVGVP